ncbi:MAG: hypothetical protein V4640_05900 [Verrucomicrobiota bacterium]
MTPDSDDSRLTAHLLGELEAGESGAIESTLAADPGLRHEASEIRSVCDLLKTDLAPGAETLLPAQRENIRRAINQRATPSSLATFQRWFIPAAAAAVLAIGTFTFIHMSGKVKPEVVVARPVESSTANEVAKTATPAVAIPPRPDIRSAPLSPTDSPSLALPVIAARGNLEAISNSITTAGAMPSAESVRLEEILNNFPLRLAGTAAIARGEANAWHPDNRQAGMTRHVATLGTELIACPWKPSAKLLIISLRANARTDSSVKLTYHPNPATVLRYRLLGFQPAAGASATAAWPERLPAGSFVNLAVEIEPATAASADLGSLEWSADGASAPAVSLVHRKDAEPSDDARFAALVCLWAQWLVGTKSGLIDAEMVAALAREISSATLAPERMDFLVLINSSLQL